MGLGWFFGRIVGSIPGPIIYGVVIDSSCSLWDDKCGSASSCLVYDSKEFRMGFLILPISLRIVTVIFVIASLFTYEKTQKNGILEGVENVAVDEEHDASEDINDISLQNNPESEVVV